MSLNHVSAIGLAVMLLLTGCMGSDDLEKDDSDLTTLNAPWWEGGLQYAPPMR